MVQGSNLKAYSGTGMTSILHLQALTSRGSSADISISTRSVLWWLHAAGAAAALWESSLQSCQLGLRPRSPPGSQSPSHSSLRRGRKRDKENNLIQTVSILTIFTCMTNISNQTVPELQQSPETAQRPPSDPQGLPPVWQGVSR